MSVFVYVSTLQESVLLPSLILALQSVTSSGNLSFTQRNIELYSFMCQSNYVSSYFIIIHLGFVFCFQTESSSRG